MKSDVLSPLISPKGLSVFAEGWRNSLFNRRARGQRHDVYFMLFAASALLSTYGRTAGDNAGILAALAALLGSLTCGWGWLFVRSLFMPRREAMAVPLRAVLFILALQCVSAAGSAVGVGEMGVLRMTDAAIGMVGSTFVIITFAEIARHVPDAPAGPERQFRQVFTAGYFALILVAVFMLEGASEESFLATHTKTIQSLAALFAVGGALSAVRFRHRHPLTSKLAPSRAVRSCVEPSAADKNLARRVEDLVRKPEIFTQPSLKVADVAAQLGEHDYLVSKAITQVLGQPNFNRYVNRLRIEQAQIMLHDRKFDQSSILVIALDCGFASIGPFNRTFREEVGMSPSAYRQHNSCTK